MDKWTVIISYTYGYEAHLSAVIKTTLRQKIHQSQQMGIFS